MFCEWQDKGKENEARAKLGLQPIQREAVPSSLPTDPATAAGSVDSTPRQTSKAILPARRVGKRIPKGCK